MGKIICITGAKGGVGKTTTAVNLALTLSRSGSDVLLIDINEGFRNADVLLGYDDIIAFDYYDVTSEVCSFKDAVISGINPEYCDLDFLPCAQNTYPYSKLSPQVLKLIKEKSSSYDYTIIDCKTYELSGIIYIADSVVVVSTLSRQSVKNTEKYIADIQDGELIAEYEAEDIHKRLFCVFSCVTKRDLKTFNLEELMYLLGVPILGIIPYDKAFITYGNSSTPYVTTKRKNGITAFNNIAARQRGEKLPLLHKVKLRNRG